MTSFQFNVSFLRSLLSNGSYESVSGSSITLVYSDCNFCGNYTEISTTRALSEADFYQGSTNWPSNNAHLTLNAELPINKTTGFLMIKHVYFDSNQNKTLTEYISNTTIGVQVPVPSLKNAITINGVPKVETILFGADCGFVHAYGTPTYSPGHMEKDVWKFAYDVNYTKVNSSVLDSDIYWEWLVEDNSQYIPLEKQFIPYPYGTGRLTQLNGNKKVTIEANDLLDEYSSKARVWARSRSTGSRLSSDYILYLSGVNH